MARVVKHPDVRREELMDTALDLFASVGYDPLSIEQITQASGVAKGTFYYYFTSKQDLLVQIIARFGDQIFDYLNSLLPQLTGSAVQRFQQLLTAAASFKTAHRDDTMVAVPLLYKPENLEVRHRLFDEWYERCRPLFHPLVDQGRLDGSFDVADSRATTEIVLSLWMDASIRMFERAIAAETEDEFVAQIVRGQTALILAVERVLGAPSGTFELGDHRDQYRAIRDPFLTALHAGAPVQTPVARSRRAR